MRASFRFLFFVVMGLSAGVSRAVITEPDRVRENISSTCLIEFFSRDPKAGNEKAYGFCSATLISPSTVLSAAHCQGLVASSKTIYSQVKCANGETHRIQGSGLRFPHELDSSVDLALFQVNAPFTSVTPLPIVESSSEQARLLSSPSNCRAAGWGKDGDGNYGKLITAELDQVDLDPITVSDEGYPVRLKNRMMLRGKTLVQPGDSGGSLVCKQADGQWVLVGVPVEGFKKNSSQVELLGAHADWIRWGSRVVDRSVSELFVKMTRAQEYCAMLTQCLQTVPPQVVDLIPVIQKTLADLESERVQFRNSKKIDADEVAQLRERWSQLNEALLKLAISCTKTK